MLGVVGQKGLIAAYPGVVVYVTRFSHPHYRVNKQVGLDLLRGLKRELLVGPVHGVSGLKGDYPPPAKVYKLCPKLGRG
jgi:hypothetical protein